MTYDGFSDDTVPVAKLRQVDRRCDAFEQEWRSGNSPRLEAYLEDLPERERRLLLRELVELELHYRNSRGERNSLSHAEYSNRFPDSKAEVTTAFQSSGLLAGSSEDVDFALNIPAASGTNILAPGEVTDVNVEDTKPYPPAILQELREYSLLEQIGRGGMGTVYRAVHTKLDRVVALKVLPQELTDNAVAVARFEREQRAVGKLDHPNIVRATDAGEVNDVHFLVMEYVEGVDLGELVNINGVLNVPDACEVIRQAAVGLQHAHEHGLVHRDIKPSNLMLSVSGTVKLLDLGLARLRADDLSNRELTRAGQVMGTVDYMAPEQAQETHGVDIRADIYSLGCTFYRLLTGEPPFGSRSPDVTPMAICLAHAQTPFPSVRAIRSDVPEALEAALLKMVAKRPDDRPRAPNDVVALMESFCAGANLRKLVRPDSTGDDDLPAPSLPPVTRRRWPLVVGILLACLLAAVAWFNLSRDTLTTNVIKALDPQRDAVGQTWELNDEGILTSPDIDQATLRLPCDMPDEFRLSFTANRLRGLTFMLVNVSDTTPFVIEVGARVVVSNQIDGGSPVVPSDSNGGLFASWGNLADFTPRHFVLSISPNRVKLQRDDVTEFDETGDIATLGNPIPDDVPKKPGFYLCTRQSQYAFSEITLTRGFADTAADP